MRVSLENLLAEGLLSSNSFITFTGGEPTLEIPSMIGIFRLLNERCFPQQFHLQTNGLCRRRLIRAFEAIPLTHLTISIDGDQRIHDECRIDLNGRGTYERVVETARLCINLRDEGRLRSLVAQATITKSALPLKDSIGSIIDLGFDKVIIGAVFGKEPGVDFGVSPEVFAKEYFDFQMDVLESLLTESPFIDDITLEIIKDTILPGRKKHRCGAGTTMIAVSPSGDLYPCSTLAGMGMGRINGCEQIQIRGILDGTKVESGDGYCLFDTCEHGIWRSDSDDLSGRIRGQTMDFMDRMNDAEVKTLEENLVRLVIDG